MSRLCGCSLLITDTTCSTILWFNQNVDLTIFSSIKSKIIWWRRLLLDFVTKGSKYLVVWGAVNNIVMYRVQPEIKSLCFFFVFYNCWKKKELKKTTRVHLCFSGWVYRVHNPKIWSLSTRNPSLLGIWVRAGPYLTRWPWIFRMGLLYTAPTCAHTHIIYHPSFWEYCIKLRFCLY